jgi:hypothetical protein
MSKEFALMGLGTSDVIPLDITSLRSSYSLNTGNLLFNYAAKLLCNLSPTKMSWGSNPSFINKSCKGLLIPMANHLGEHVDLGITGPRLNDLEVPVVIFGIGVQSKLDKDPVLPQGTRDWIESAGKLKASAAPNISTRGLSSTLTIQENNPNVSSIPLGCPSYLINPNPDLGARISERIKSIDVSDVSIAVSAGNPYKRELNALEHQLISLVNNTNGIYIVQHPKSMLELSLGYSIDDKGLELARKSFFPLLSSDNMKKWLRRHSRVYVSVSQWFTDIQRYDFHVGTRIHGSQAAIQAGIPSVCLYIDSRTKELCTKMRIPHAPAIEFFEVFSLENLIELCRSWDWDEYDRQRIATAIQTDDFLSRNGIDPSQHLKRLIA